MRVNVPTFIRVMYRVIYDAIYHFTLDDGFAMASHVALSTLLAIFPFLIFGTALASFLGADRFSETAVLLIFETWPEVIAKPISNEVIQVLTIPRGGLLTLSVLAAAYFASNGVEALRVSLNRAYRTVETRPWYLTRVISLFYVLVAVMVLAAVSIAFVAVPIAIRFTWEWLPWMARLLSLIDNWRIYVGIVTLLIGLLVAHLWLPAGRRKVGDVLPGIILTLAFWLGGAWAFAAYLATFANYAATYAGLASLMIALIFLYIVGVIFIIGAEFNAALLKYRVRHIVSKRLSGSDHSQADTLPDRLR
ncbi:MAG: hypothetical protein RIR97_1383 [Pseudomonadota bacterium]